MCVCVYQGGEGDGAGLRSRLHNKRDINEHNLMKKKCGRWQRWRLRLCISGIDRGKAACVTRDGDWEGEERRVVHGKTMKGEGNEWRKGVEWWIV